METKKEVMAREIHRTYQELLGEPEWFEFVCGVKARKGAACEVCESEDRLEIHHLGYKDGRQPWEYADHEVQVLCNACHGNIHKFADDLWNEVLKAKNQWIIYECAKAVKAVMERHAIAECETADFNLR